MAVFFFSGIQLFFLGVLGEYVGAIHSQVRKRPLVIERGRFNFHSRRSPEQQAAEAISVEHAARGAVTFMRIARSLVALQIPPAAW